MTVTAAPRLAGPYDGNDSADTFAFDFKIFTDADLQVVFLSVLAVESTLTLDVDYTVDMNEDQDSAPGGSITLTAGALATGARLTINGGLVVKQETDLTNLGGLYPQVIEDALDRQVMLIGQIQAENTRAVRVPVSLSDINTDLPVPVAGAALIWNETGDAIVNGVGASGFVGLSSFMANVIQAADAAEVRGDIGAAADETLTALDAAVVKLTGTQTVAGAKTFSSSPIVPTPTTNFQACTKAYADTVATNVTAAAVAPATLAPTLLVAGTPALSTSGTSIPFTGIPSWAKRVTMIGKAVSTNGTSRLQVQIGDTGSGSYITTGYSCLTAGILPAGVQGTNAFTDGVALFNASALAAAWDFRVTFSRIDAASGNWMFDGCAGRSDNSGIYQMVGGVAVVGSLDKIRLTSAGGDTLDAGQINAMWE
jgi:hypothetical protein